MNATVFLSRNFHVCHRAVLALAAVIALVIAFPAHLPAQWAQTSGPYGANVRTFLVSGSSLYAGTSSGVFGSTNNGTSWNAGGLISLTVRSLATSGASLFAGTSGSGVYVSSDNGATWSASGLGFATVNALAVMGTNLFAGTSGYAVYISRDGGANWSGVSATLPDTTITALAVIGTSLFAGSNTGYIYRTTDNGATWTDISSALTSVNYIYSLYVNGSTLYTGTNDGVYRTTDSGTNWIPSGLGSTTISSIASSGTSVFAGTSAGVYLSTGGSTTWTPVDIGLTNTHISSLAAIGTSIFAGTNSSGVYLSSNNGSSWSPARVGLTGTYVWGMAASPAPGGTGPKALFAGTNDGVSASTDDGSNWINISAGLPSTTIYTLAISDTTLFAGTNGNGAYYITLNGFSWSPMTNGLPATSYVRAFTTGTGSGPTGVNLFAGTDGNGAFLSTNGGASWSAVNSGLPVNASVYALATTPAAAGTTPNLFAGIFGTGVFRSTNNGGSWTVASIGLPAGANVYALAVSPPTGGTGSSNLYAGTFGTGVFLSTNDGASWTAVNSGLPPPPGAYVYSFAVSGTALYAGLYGGVYVSTNNGATWTAEGAGALAGHSILSLASSASALFAGTTRGVWSENKAAYPSSYALVNTIPLPSHSGASSYITTDYRLVGLPGNSQFGVQVLFPTSYKNELNYRVSWDNGGSSSYIVRYDGTSTFNCTTGRAFWVIGDGPITLNINVATALLNANREAEIPLHTGWNLITNPFTGSIAWSSIQTYNGISEPIYGFTGSYGLSTTFDPYAGYYYYNANNAILLKIPYSLTSGITIAQAPDPVKWRIGIKVSDGVVSDNTASLGVVAQPSALARKLNYHKPRLLDGGISASFNRPDLDAVFPAYATDIRPESDGAQEWPFDLSAKQGSRVSVHFSGVAKVPPAYEVWLIDEQNGRAVDLRSDSSYVFTPVLARSRFSVLVGRHGSVQDRLASALPAEFALDQNFPNPFNPSTTIPVAVPRESDVALTVYNMLGAEVAVLQRGRLQAGRYWFTWNGIDGAGRTLATGAYMIRLQAGGKTMVSKALLVK